MDILALRGIADRLIMENGNEVTLIRYVNSGDYDENLGDYPKVPEEFHTKMSIQNFDSSELVENVTNMTDLKGYIRGEIPVDKTWSVVYSGAVWKIVHIVKTTAKDITALTELWIRA